MDESGKVFLGAAAGSAAGVGIAELLKGKPVSAGTTPNGQVDYTALLQSIITGQTALGTKLNTIGGQLDQIITALGGATASRRADKFGQDNQNLIPNQPYKILDEGNGKGSLAWLLIDTQSPNVLVSIILDSVQYDFNVAQMILEGIMFPTYPGAWMTRADPIGPPPTFCLMFSVGNLDGYGYNQRINISVTNIGLIATTLNHSYGVKWIFG